MAEARYGGVLRYVHTLFSVGAVGGLTDGELLERFTTGPAEVAELAFTAMVERHGPMVLRVCRSVLRESNDAQDAFQAVFMVLARRAGAIRGRDSLASWLYGVAYRVSSSARAAAARRRKHEKRAAEQAAQAVNTNTHEPDEFTPRLHDEINRLPEKLRAPMVLCYLEGLTHDQAAHHLRLPVGTVHSRLNRARELLRQRLSRRGFATNEAAFTAALASESIPAALIDSTVKASLSFVTKQAAAAVLATASADALARGVLQTMNLTKWKLAATAALGCVVAFGGVRVFAYQFGGAGGFGGGASQPSSAAAESQERSAAVLRSVDSIQAELVESARRNAELQQELQNLRMQVEALRAGQAGGIGNMAVAKAAAEGSAIPAKAAARGAAGKGGPNRGDIGGGRARFGGAGSRGGGSSMGAGFITGESGSPGTGMGGGGMVRPGGMMSEYPGMSGASGRMMAGGMGNMGGMMGGMGGGMPGVMGSTFNAAEWPHHQWVGNLILMSAPGGEKVTLFDIESGKTRSLKLAASQDDPVQVTPIYGGTLGALLIKGKKISRLAVFDTEKAAWFPIDLREPVDGSAIPVIGGRNVAYAVGRYIYAFSSEAGRWDVLELPEGTDARPVVSDAAVTFDHDGHLYVFSAGTGKWKDIDSRAALDSEGNEEPKDPAKP